MNLGKSNSLQQVAIDEQNHRTIQNENYSEILRLKPLDYYQFSEELCKPRIMKFFAKNNQSYSELDHYSRVDK